MTSKSERQINILDPLSDELFWEHKIFSHILPISMITHHIFIRLSYGVNSPPPSATYMSINWIRIGSRNRLPPVQRQAITSPNVALLSIWPLGTNLSEIWIKIQNFLFIKMYFKMSSLKWLPFCPGGNGLRNLALFTFLGWRSPNQFLTWFFFTIFQNQQTKYPAIYPIHIR